MQLLWSDWKGTGTSRDAIRPAVTDAIGAAGGLLTIIDLRAQANQGVAVGRCIVACNVAIPTPTLPARALADDTQLDAAIPGAVRTFVNAQLGVSAPAGLTWRQLVRFLIENRYGVVVGARLFRLGRAGDVDL